MYNESKLWKWNLGAFLSSLRFMSLLKGPLLMKTAPVLIERQRLEHRAPRRDATRSCATYHSEAWPRRRRPHTENGGPWKSQRPCWPPTCSLTLGTLLKNSELLFPPPSSTDSVVRLPDSFGQERRRPREERKGLAGLMDSRWTWQIARYLLPLATYPDLHLLCRHSHLNMAITQVDSAL